MNNHEELITRLSEDLEPVAPAPDVNRLGMSWFLVSALFVVAITNLALPIRPGAYSQLAAEPRFLIETLLGVAAIAWTSLLAFRAAVPAALSRPFAMVGLALMVLWLAQYVVGLVSPALEPSELGKRPFCYLETMVYSLPLIVAALYLVRRLYPLRFTRTAMAFSLAAGMIPALYMQLACMYKATHILTFHILPGLFMVLVGAAIATLWQRRQEETPAG